MSSNPYWPDPPEGADVIRLHRTGEGKRFVIFGTKRRVRAPLGARRPALHISRHAVDHALHVAAWGSHVCRPFPVQR